MEQSGDSGTDGTYSQGKSVEKTTVFYLLDGQKNAFELVQTLFFVERRKVARTHAINQTKTDYYAETIPDSYPEEIVNGARIKKGIHRALSQLSDRATIDAQLRGERGPHWRADI